MLPARIRLLTCNPCPYLEANIRIREVLKVWVIIEDLLLPAINDVIIDSYLDPELSAQTWLATVGA
jgi:hypothetical protein